MIYILFFQTRLYSLTKSINLKYKITKTIYITLMYMLKTIILIDTMYIKKT